MKVVFSIDTEEDLHSGKDIGITEGLLKFEKICDDHGIKPILFVVAPLILKHKELFRRLDKKGWEISLHGLTHKRFDSMNYEEKVGEIKESLIIWKKVLGGKPKGFRAPQHSIDSQTIEILESNGFEYDSSYTPLNILQFIFFPRKLKSNFRNFFSWPWKHRIYGKLEERPVSSFLIPPVSLVVRAFPKKVSLAYFKFLRIIYREVMFYAHSWDFIEIPESRIDRTWSHKRFIENLSYIMERLK